MNFLLNALLKLGDGLLLVAGVALALIVATWLADKAIERMARLFKLNRMVCEYIWHRTQFKAWLAKNCKGGRA